MTIHQLDALAERLERDLPRLLDEHNVPGAAVGIAAGDTTVEFAAGVLHRDTRLAVTTDSVFHLASVTKAWTATLVMQLVDEGLVELDAPVRRYVPQFRVADDAVSAAATVRHLLTHTGGFDGGLLDDWAGQDALDRYVRHVLPNARGLAAPGRLFSYCNGGFGVLGRMVELFRGLPYPEAARRHLAEPLGLERFATGAEDAIGLRTAMGHIGHDPERPPEPSRRWSGPACLDPAGGLAMSVGDLLRFARMHLADGRAPSGARILSPESARAMREPHVAEPAAIMAFAAPGLGWFLPGGGRDLLAADGGGIGHRAFLRLAPGHGVAVALTANGSRGERMVGAVIGSVLRELTGIDLSPPPVRGTPPAADATNLAGRYQSSEGKFVVAAGDDGHLRIDHELSDGEILSDLPEVNGTLRPTDSGAFDIVGPDGDVIDFCAFVTGPDGRAELLHFGGTAVPRVA